MSTRAPLLLALLSLFACAASSSMTARRVKPGARAHSSFEPGDYDVAIRHDGRDRYYIAHIPPQARAGRPLPIVLNIHGGGGNAVSMARWTQMNPVADEHGFIVIYPGGTGNPKFGRRLLAWDAGFCCGPNLGKVDDVGFILAVLRDVARRTPVDHTRVYATGISNGGFMSYRLAIDLSSRIAAIAPVAGSLPDPAGVADVAVLDIHSKDDPRALYDGGRGPPFPYTNSRVNHPPTEKVLAQWAGKNGCKADRQVVETIPADKRGHTAKHIVYSDCRQGADVEQWLLTGAGHVWPGFDAKTPVQRFLGEESNVIDASREAWKFFSRHRKPNAPSLTDEAPPVQSSAALRTEDVLDSAPFEITFNRSFVGLATTGTAPSDVADLDGEYSHRSIAASSALSLYSKARMRAGRLQVFRIQAQASARLGTTEVPMLSGNQRMLAASVGVAGIYVSPKLNLYGLYVGASVAEQTSLLDAPKLRPLALGLGTHRFGDRFSLLYGGAFTYVFGRPLPIPVLGLSYQPAKSWSLILIAPVVASARYRISRGFALAALIGANGEQYRIENAGRFASTGDAVTMRVGGAKAGLAATYRLSADFNLRAETGVIAGRRIRFLDEGRSIMSGDVAPAGYLNFSVSYAFGSLPY